MPEASSARKRAGVVLLLYLGGLAYLSLYPWQWMGGPGLDALMWSPLRTRAQAVDAALNVLFYLPLGAAACLAMRRSAAGWLGAGLLGTLVSLAVEWMQLHIPERHGNLRDLAANSLGAFLGATLALAAPKLERVSPAARLLVPLWALWQGFLLGSRRWSWAEGASELLGIGVLLMALRARVPRWAPPVLLLWMAGAELRPFRFDGPAMPFSWLPFEGWFRGAPESYYAAIFGKLFLYTGIVWTIRQRGAPWTWAVSAPAAILALGEWAQRYLPGRTPESTDLALLAAGALLLALTGPTRT